MYSMHKEMSDGESEKMVIFNSTETVDENSLDTPSTSSLTMGMSGQDMDNSLSSNNIPLILTPDYFTIINKRINTQHQRLSSGVIALCQVCNKKIAGSKKVTSNFLQHYKNKHPHMYQKYLGEKGKSQGTNRKSKIQNNFDEKVLNFVIRTYSPLSIVENPAFLALFEGTQRVVKSRRFIANLLDEKFNTMISEIKQNLSKIEYICCTADIWRSSQQSFFGYTCHWINANFERNSCALACRRFRGTHTLLRIADIIQTINMRYGISGKQLVCTVTNNGSNFVEAFKDFGIKSSDQYIDSRLEDMNTTFDPSLMLHQNSRQMRCASHTLTLIATTDFLTALQKADATYEIHQNAIKKCSQIWNKCQCQKTAELLTEILSASLKLPTITRWNSLYDAIIHLLSFSEKLDEITQVTGVESFVFSEVEYLTEYCFLVKPITESLHFIQNENDIYLGYLVPTLLTLKATISKYRVSPHAKYLIEVAKEMESKLTERFREFFELQPTCHDIVVAAITCPPVKILKCEKLLKIWERTAPNCNSSHLIDIFVKKVIENGPVPVEFSNKRKTVNPSLHRFFSPDLSDEDDLHEPVTQERNMEICRIVEELKKFTENESTSMSTLNDYPIVKHMFYKFNTPLPSSAPVERLLSFAGIVNHNSRQHATADDFEKLVVLNANS